MTDKYIGYGQQIYRGDGATPEVFTKIPQSKDIKPPSPKVKEVGMTNNDSPAKTEESVPGFINRGECTFKLIYDVADPIHAALLADCGDMDSKGNYRILHPDTAGTKETFEAWVSGFDRDMPTEDGVTATVTLKVTGPSTFS
jgi:hypothetical protein